MKLSRHDVGMRIRRSTGIIPVNRRPSVAVLSDLQHVRGSQSATGIARKWAIRVAYPVGAKLALASEVRTAGRIRYPMIRRTEGQSPGSAQAKWSFGGSALAYYLLRQAEEPTL